MEQESDAKQLLANKALENLRMRLLDLTARNRLINFRHTISSSLRVIDELPNQLVETLLAETELRFKAIPEPTESELINAGFMEFEKQTDQLRRKRNNPSSEEWAKYLGFMTSYEVPPPSAEVNPKKHSDTAIQTLLYPPDMEARLKSLIQSAESAIQEMGTNILYLALGFLEWFENVNSDSARIAPLFLVPVSLKKGCLNPETRTYEYTLSYSGEDIISNLSLREKLRADFAMALPDLDENILPEDYFKEIQMLINDKQPRWRVCRYISLTLLNFSKQLMYLDLDPSRWPQEANIAYHPVVSSFLSGYAQEAGAEKLNFGEEYSIDTLNEIHVKYPLIDDADSSQHSALIDAIDGKHLIIEGPPGTGKSQTITNLIAAAMAQGKKVLFVAEKLAALEVVRSRLDKAGLGEFCLEIHSHKSQKRKVLDEVADRLKKHGRYRNVKDIEVEIARFEELKTTLKIHAEKINRPWKNTGKTLHEIFMAATRYRNASGVNPQDLHPVGYDGNNYNTAVHRRNADQVGVYCKLYKTISHQLDKDAVLQEHPWYGVRNGDLQIFDLDRVTESLETWQESLQQFNLHRKHIAHALGCDVSLVAETLPEAYAFLEELQSIPALRGDEILEILPVLRDEVLENTGNYLKLFEDIQSQYEILSKTIDLDILNDLTIVDQLLLGIKHLQQLVGREVKVCNLAEAITRLTTIKSELVQLEEPLQGVLLALGNPATKHLKISMSGLTEFKMVIEHIASLNLSYWKFRDELFDNEELDELLPQLRAELLELQNLHESLRGVFSLENVPTNSEIYQLKNALASGGILRWFKSNWRAARRQLISCATNTQVKFPDMVKLLDNLAIYAEKRQQFEQSVRYNNELGEYFKGLDTNLPALETLRYWYKRIRQYYGVGFGQKVSLGDAILELPPATAKAVHSLAEHGINNQLIGLLDELDRLRVLLAPTVDLNNDDTLLVGENGAISSFLVLLNQALQNCGSLIWDNSLSIAELGDRIEQIRLLKQKIEMWQKADIDGKIFQSLPVLKTGIDTDNSVGLSSFRSTLELAIHIDKRLHNQALVKHIYRQPAAITFSTLASYTDQLRDIMASQKASYDTYADLVCLDLAGWTNNSGDQIGNLTARNQLAMSNSETLQNWLDYVRVRDQLQSLGLGRLATVVENCKIEIDRVEDAYQAGIFDVLAREILREDPELGRFSGHSQEVLQEKFREYDNRLKNLQCEQIAWKIDQAKIPMGKMGARVSERTEKTLLEHECGKKTRHIPIRQLLQRAGNALVALKPCFMMGPMSVAQYLAPGKITFDLVVMDEASQIKPQEALGAIARGGQLVVVGDPKQLPPTSFFDRILEEDEDDPTGIEESESILDATLTMFPRRRLRWHYRSQHETLIAFSNYSFYESDLVIFPSPHNKTENFGIQYSRVSQGCFVNRRNMEEARIISEAVRKHFEHHSEETLGVVAMNAEQRLQIQLAIELLAKDDPVFQERLDRDATRHESLFIKNLENVQGDERDVIFISMTYGPQEPGSTTVHQRFGPINSDVGWRRLNVLFTRSKKRMHIFSSMGSQDIIIGSTSKRGVHALHDFLKYCETGILHKTERDTGRGPDSDFEIAVMDALKKEGFECVPQVGVAGFFIDVAVIDPGNPGRYLMGIECDGATYHSAKSARDRDRLRQSILERLGWRICRIWSTDWFKNPNGELAPIIRELHEIKSPVIRTALKKESEVAEIEQIIENISAQEVYANQLASDRNSLKNKFIRWIGK